MWISHWVCLTACGLRLAAAGPSTPGEPIEQALRVARSADGLTFRDTGEIVTPNACAPGLVQLPHGQLLAVFNAGGANRTTTLCVARSKDQGRSWSQPQPIRLTPDEIANRGTKAELLAMPDGLLRMYFIMAGRQGKSKTLSEPMVIGAASRDGVNYRVDEAVQITLDNSIDPHLAVFRLANDIGLFIADEKAERNYHQVSSDGRMFRPAAWPAELNGVRSIVPIEQGYRAYLATSEGVVSAVSKDGQTWTKEPGVRLPGRWDPAVVRLRGGEFLMIYAPLRDPESAQALPLAGGSPGGSPASPEESIDKRTQALKHTRDLIFGCFKYAEKHNGQLPPDLETLVDGGFAKADALVSPVESSPGSASYIYIEGQTNTMDPRNIVAYEKLENHGGAGTAVLFLDGHAQWMTPEKLDAALQETYQRLGR